MNGSEISLSSSNVLEGNDWKSISIAESLFLISLVSMFLPVKVYPVFFLITSFFLYREAPTLTIQKWVVALLVFSAYAIISYVRTAPDQVLALTFIVKMLINFTFLFFTVNWVSTRDNESLLGKLDVVLLGVLLLSFIQLMIYHQAYDFRLIFGSDTSGQASSLYKPTLYYWGLSDKNMFGARIALIGFAFICISVVCKKEFSIWRVSFVFLIAFLSLSRTPLVALFLGVFLLAWICVGKKWKIVLLILVASALPFVLQKVLRVDTITSSNDGMGIRLVYWKAFFNHFTSISPLGNGFMSAPEFLQKYADFYRGEPHIHNTFLTTYLEMGVIGFFSYLAFLFWFVKACIQRVPNVKLWAVLFLPLVSIMMILYSGYDNDLIVYLALIFLIGTYTTVDFKKVKISL